MDKILFISASSTNGSCRLLLEEIQKKFWLKYSTEVAYIRDFESKQCLGCRACQDERGECVLDDKIHILLEKMLDAKIVVFATPNYFYNMTGLAKNFIDRAYRYYKNRKLEGKKFIFLYTGGDTSENIKRYLDNAVYGFIKCQGLNSLGSFAISTQGEGVYTNPQEKDMVVAKITKLIADNIDL